MPLPTFNGSPASPQNGHGYRAFYHVDASDSTSNFEFLLFSLAPGVPFLSENTVFDPRVDGEGFRRKARVRLSQRFFVTPRDVVQLGLQVQVGHDVRSVGRRMDEGLQNVRAEMNLLKVTRQATVPDVPTLKRPPASCASQWAFLWTGQFAV